jgi:ferritin-like metal-binding protein YciE
MAEETNPLQELLVDQLKDLYSAENQIIKALPKMAKNATNEQLRVAFERHLEETRGQVARLEQIAGDMDISLRGKKCKGAEGLIEEGKEAMEEFEGDVLDAALIGATMLGLTKVARLLQQTLDEEGRADKKLTDLAERVVNLEALQEG